MRIKRSSSYSMIDFLKEGDVIQCAKGIYLFSFLVYDKGLVPVLMFRNEDVNVFDIDRIIYDATVSDDSGSSLTILIPKRPYRIFKHTPSPSIWQFILWTFQTMIIGPKLLQKRIAIERLRPIYEEFGHPCIISYRDLSWYKPMENKAEIIKKTLAIFEKHGFKINVFYSHK